MSSPFIIHTACKTVRNNVKVLLEGQRRSSPLFSYGRRHSCHLSVVLTSTTAAAVLGHHTMTYADSSVAVIPTVPIIHSPASDNTNSYLKILNHWIHSLQWLERKVHTLWVLVLRSLYLMLVFSPALVSCPVLLIGHEPIVLRWWSLLRDCIRMSGPCATKFAQWIATRPDLFPLSMCQHLQDLQSKVYRHRWHDTETALIEAFGCHWEEKVQIDWVNVQQHVPVVLGSGCVAQVIRGFVNDQPVAIKIVHPGVQEAIDADIAILGFLAWAVEHLPGSDSMSLSECVEEFSLLMTQQLDMQLEAHNLIKFRENFHLHSTLNSSRNISSNSEKSTASTKIASLFDSYLQQWRQFLTGVPARVTFPEPLVELTTSHVLIELYQDGTQISELLDHMTMPSDKASSAANSVLTDAKLRRDVALAGLDAILKMVFEDNFIHADLHPGNVIFQQHGNHDWNLSFIDAGLVAQLQPDDRKNFIDLFAAVVRNDGVRVGELMVERSRGGGVSCRDKQGFARQIGELVHDVNTSGLALGKVGIGGLLQKVLVLCYIHKVKLESKFVAVIIAMGVLEGLGRRLDPDIDVLLRAAPYVLRAALLYKSSQTS